MQGADFQTATSASYALIVDDNPVVLHHASKILAAAGFRCLEAVNVEQGIALMERHWAAVKLLFTDVKMPGDRDGFSLAREVAQRWAHVGIIVASGSVQPNVGDLPDGAAFIAKPFSAEIIRHNVRTVLPNEQQPEPVRKS